jgi:hypothetical protein
MDINKPDFLKIGAIVKVQHWYGEIVDIAVSDTRIMVLVTSPKALWRHHPAEWLEFDAEQITATAIAEAVADFDTYVERVSRTLHEIEALRDAWQERAA